jgi:hypothetical protein
MFHTKVVEKIKTHILCSATFPKNRGVYEIMWENMAERDSSQMAIWRMRFACWLRKATETHSRGNNVYKNAPECYPIRILPVIFTVQSFCLIRKNVI